MSRELGILFKPDMHLAIREGRKTQTRRIIKPAIGATDVWGGEKDGLWSVHRFGDPCHQLIKPRYRVGDLLYVKEAFGFWDKYMSRLEAEETAIPDGPNGLMPGAEGYWRKRLIYRSDGEPDPVNRWVWKSPIHMPKWAARTWLEVTGVRAERLQDISEADAIAEGVFGPPTSQAGWREYPYESCHLDTAKSSYRTLWESINGPGSWYANPWVWVYEFRRIER